MIYSDLFSFGILTCRGKVYGMFIDRYLRYASMTLRVKSDSAVALNLHLATMPLGYFTLI
jgi:hypothetical protein